MRHVARVAVRRLFNLSSSSWSRVLPRVVVVVGVVAVVAVVEQLGPGLRAHLHTVTITVPRGTTLTS